MINFFVEVEFEEKYRTEIDWSEKVGGIIMGSKITGKEYSLNKIFSKEFDYYIPTYQRPYAWTEEETETLFDDLYDFFIDEQSDNYFLGSIVLIKEDDKPHADVIDGQQRLTTLTILMAVVASHLSGENQTNCMSYIREAGNALEGLESLPRLHLRDKDQKFFNKYIQNLKIDDVVKIDKETLENESQVHIKENCELLMRKFNEKFADNEDKIINFCRFLVTRCYLVAVYTPSQQSAFRVFSVMNSRGLNLMPIDIIKSDIIGQIESKDQQEYTEKWEDLEIKTTRAGFNEVFTHTRMIYAKSKSKQNLLEEFREYVISKFTPKQLIDDILEPYCEAYKILKDRKYASTGNASKINENLYWLNKIDNSDWMPSAIKFFADNKNNSEYILWFVQKLERLASYLHITAKDVNHRIERYKSILDEMESNPDHNINDKLSSVDLTNNEKIEFKNALDGDIYLMTGKRRNYVILRLNAFVSDGAMGYDSENSVLTIEHVLPQTVNPNSEWEKLWPEIDKRKLWINRIANLVPLTRKKNSEAQNYDFEKKKDVYFKGKNGTTSYPLTTQILNEHSWTVDIVEKRQINLMKVFEDNWNLKTYQRMVSDDDDFGKLYIINKRGANASGYVGSQGFVVEKNSIVSSNVVDKFNTNYPNAYKLREELIKNSIVVDGIFVEDYEFESISLAASVVLGRNASGKREWVDKNGVRYCEITDNKSSMKSFNLADETTYTNIKVGSLAYAMIKDLIEKGKISNEEIEKLKTKEYTKQLFNRTDYPVLASTRDANMGGSNVIRYRKEPINYKGQLLFVTTQWFVGNRNDIIAWYKKHHV